MEQNFEILKSLVDEGRVIHGCHGGIGYDIALIEMKDDHVECWEEMIGDFSILLEDFDGCQSEYSIENEIWHAFIEKLKAMEERADGRLMSCARCGHHWFTRVSSPKKCPVCQARLGQVE
ncbi:MAG TPA: hypothetical protein PLJ11_08650 [Methanomassiliicoccales archaeon]|nr:hypothetical protein [Methanomassiliicoccales archaeon]